MRKQSDRWANEFLSQEWSGLPIKVSISNYIQTIQFKPVDSSAYHLRSLVYLIQGIKNTLVQTLTSRTTRTEMIGPSNPREIEKLSSQKASRG